MSRSVTLPEQFGRYRILKKVGEGGMGAVYLAEDTKLRRQVALKVPHLKTGTRTAVLERFQREARLAAGIDHPNFCAVHDVDEIDGVQFFNLALRIIRNHDLDWPQHREPPKRALVQVLTDGMFEHGNIG